MNTETGDGFSIAALVLYDSIILDLKGRRIMRREARVCKLRDCEGGHPRYATARELKEHTAICKRARDIGLVLPGNLHRPSGYSIIRTGEETP